MCTYALQIVPRTELVGCLFQFQRIPTHAYGSPNSSPAADSAGCTRLLETLLSRPLITRNGGKTCYKIPRHYDRDKLAIRCSYVFSVFYISFINHNLRSLPRMTKLRQDKLNRLRYKFDSANKGSSWSTLCQLYLQKAKSIYGNTLPKLGHKIERSQCSLEASLTKGSLSRPIRIT